MAPASSHVEQAVVQGSDETALRAVVICVVFPTRAHALLFDLVQGTPRFVAAAQSHPSAEPRAVIDQVRSSLDALAVTTGRQLLQDGNLITPRHPTGDGVDLLVVTGIPIHPFTACLVTLDDESTLPHTLASALRRTPAAVVHAPSDLQGAALRRWLREHQPDILVATCHTPTPSRLDACREGIHELLGYGCPPSLGLVIAPEAVQQAMADEFGTQFELVGVDPSAYPSPAIASAIAKELRERYRQAARAQLAALGSTRVPVIDLLEAIERATSFIYRRTGAPTLVLSMTTGVTIALATEGHLSLRYWADRDLSMEALGLLTLPPAEVLRWLPWDMPSDALAEWALNRTLRPTPQLVGQRDRYLAAACARALLQQALHDLQVPTPLPVQLVCCDPVLLALGPELAALTVLDSCQPAPAGGRVTLALDDAHVVPALGALAAFAPAYAAAALEEDGLLPLAECLVLNGPVHEAGAPAVRGQLVQGQSRRQFSVPQGSLLRLPLTANEPAMISLHPVPGMTEPLPTVDAPLTPPWPLLGVLIDARGRPLVLADQPTQRQRQLQSWIDDLTAGADEQ